MAGMLSVLQRPVLVGGSMAGLVGIAYLYSRDVKKVLSLLPQLASVAMLRSHSPITRFEDKKVKLETRKLREEVVIITGADSGIGRAATTEILRRRGRVIMACRDLPTCMKTRREIVKSVGAKRVSGSSGASPR